MPSRPVRTPKSRTKSEADRLLADIREASKLLKEGRRPDAAAIYQDVRESASRNPAVQAQLGRLCREFGDIDQAAAHWAVAVEEEPDNVAYLSDLGNAYSDADELDKAKAPLERAIEIDPNLQEAQHGLGILYMRYRDHQRALGYLERACELRPSDHKVHSNLAMTLLELGRHDEALAHVKTALKGDESNHVALLTLTNILAEVGEFDAAIEHLERTLRKYPHLGFIYYQIARARKFSEKDAPLIRRAEKALKRGMPPKERNSILYALGKMHDDCGNYEQAFSFYEQANVLQKKPADVGIEDELRKATAKAFTARSLEALSDRGHESAQPVFIVGMPRSGTTLMERIIASHPKGGGAGELPTMAHIANRLFPVKDWRKAAAQIQTTLTAEKIDEYARHYLDILGQSREDAERIVDKMPGNFMFVGLAKALFPNATIIHAMRHPLDICLSCYFQAFSTLRWANEMKLIGEMYVIYRKSIKNWQKVFPEGTILDVQYERLVEDPETHARRMLDACGLDWDSSVLEFFRQKGVVKTASIAQTRQPIYKTSKMRWINYAEHLQPLVTQLAPYLQDDRELLEEHGLEVPSGGWLNRLMG